MRSPLLTLLAAALLGAGVACTPDRSTATTDPPAALADASATTLPASPAAGTAAARVEASPTGEPLAQAQPPETSGQRALRHVQMLAGEIGPRVAGAEGERAAADYISAQFRAAGLTVSLQPFQETQWTARRVSLSVLGPTPESLRVAALEPSAAGAATGELFFANLGYSSDYPQDGINGRIALVERGQLDFVVKLRNAASAGASALVIFDPNRDLVPGTLYAPVPAIPALTISGADGKRLRDRLQGEPVQVALAFEGGNEVQTYTNVIGRTAATSRCEVVVGSHYDSVSVPAASDNASGTAAMLELARLEATNGRADGVCFIAFSGEEEGLLGSKYFLRVLTDDERAAIRLMLNLDMVAVGDEWTFIGTKLLQCQATQIASGLGVSGRPLDLVGASSDHASFISRRIPSLMLHRFEDQLLHTPEDTIDRITAEPLDTAILLADAFLRELRPDAPSCP